MIYYFEKVCNLDRLEQEIRASAILVALNHLTQTGEDLEVHFNALLGGPDEIILNELIEAHVATPLDDGSQLIRFEKNTVDSEIPKIAIYEPEGQFTTFVTHDFCDRSTWYGQSSGVSAEILVVDGGNNKLYNFANENIIDVTHGRVTRENPLSYPVVIRDDNIVVTDGFEIDYNAGTILFDEVPSGVVTADYYFENGSRYTIRPESGEKLILRHAEVQFTSDVRMTETRFEVWVYNPNDLPNKVLYESVVYKNIKDLLNISNLAFTVPAFHDLTDSLMVFPFDYARAIILRDSVGAELRIYTKDDEPFSKDEASGSISFATVSLYCAVESEEE